MTRKEIDYTNPLFPYSDGSTRILRIWDQSIQDGTPPVGILYGAEYTQEDINRALSAGNPYEVVPSRDENGHGTFLAGVACGGEDVANDFIGAAPNAGIAVVKLKGAKQYLRDFFFVPEGVEAFQETHIMMAVAYLNGLANVLDMPLVICIALGNSIGSHGKNGPLSSYLNFIATRRRRSVVTAAGNEANSRHHFQGQIRGEMEYEDVEITLEEDMAGFFIELWADAPELYAVSVISPTGEQLPKIPVRTGASGEFRFVFEGTSVTVDYRIEAKETASQLIYFRYSGRGYTVSGEIKPDFVAPAVNVYGPGLRQNFVTLTGTSAAAAVTTGAVAQIMQWALVEQNSPFLSNAGIKNILIRGQESLARGAIPTGSGGMERWMCTGRSRR